MRVERGSTLAPSWTCAARGEANASRPAGDMAVDYGDTAVDYIASRPADRFMAGT